MAAKWVCTAIAAMYAAFIVVTFSYPVPVATSAAQSVIAYGTWRQVAHSHCVIVPDSPVWVLEVPLVAVTAAFWCLDSRGRASRPCRQCGYDLTGSAGGRCPECAAPEVETRALKSRIAKVVGSAILITVLTLILAPLWGALVVFGVPYLAIIWWPHRRPPLPGHCQKCGYDLTGNISGRCPECGEVAADPLDQG